MNFRIIGLQNCKNKISEKFDPAPKNGKKTILYAFFFSFVGYIKTVYIFVVI